MKKMLQTITYGLILSFMFSITGIAQHQLQSVESKGGSVELGIKDEGEWIHWDDGENNNSVGIGDEDTWIAAIRFTEADIADYDGMAITKVRIYVNHMPNGAAVVIMEGMEGNLTTVVNQAFSPDAESWNEIELDDPHTIAANQELWIGIEWDDAGDGSFPSGCDAQTDHDGKGNLVSFDGVEWDLLSDFGIAGDWNLQAFVVGDLPDTHQVTFNVDMSEALADGTFDPATHDVYVTGSFADWAEPGSDDGFKLEPVEDKSKSDVVMYEIFEDGEIPDGWLNIDANGDGYNWNIVTEPGHAPYEGEYAVISQSWDGSPLTPDNWLITHKLNIVADDWVLSFHVKAQDPDWPEEKYDVLISTTGTDLDDFSSIHSETLSADDAEWKEVVLGLNDFEGEDIYIAFRHWDCTDWFQIVLDAIKVEGTISEEPPPSGDAYTITLNVAEGDHEYKYFLVEDEPTWDMGEWDGDPNREISVFEDKVVENVFGFINFTNEVYTDDSNLNIYPNPVKYDLRVVSNDIINQVRVFDIAGRLIHSENVNNSDVQINVSDFNQGVYILQVITDNGVEAQRFNVVK